MVESLYISEEVKPLLEKLFIHFNVQFDEEMEAMGE